jgi:hydroxymethylpyrimidine/phosphomethylpyrimidine kinase
VRRAPPRVLCAAGLEPAGRAGLLADVETVRALGGEPLGVATALTAQGKGTFGLWPSTARTLQQQVAALRELGTLHAVKFGMLPGPSALYALAHALPGRIPWVVDPVVATSRGQLLSRLRPDDVFALAGTRSALTPNVMECAWLTGESPAQSPEQLAAQAARLVARGFGLVVAKGGHLPGRPVDVACTPKGVEFLPHPRLRRPAAVRGTGCRFASALAVALARGESPVGAARKAQQYVVGYLRGV